MALEQNCDTMCELSGDWNCKFEVSPKVEQNGTKMDTDQPSLSEDDEELTESKIRAFLDEKVLFFECQSTYCCPGVLFQILIHILLVTYEVILNCQALELKKLQTPLYEEFYNSLNVVSSPSLIENRRDETPSNYLKLPPKSRSPARGPAGSPSTAADVVSTGSPGSNSKHVSNIDDGGDHTPQDNSSSQVSDWRGLLGDAKQESSSLRSVFFSMIHD